MIKSCAHCGSPVAMKRTDALYCSTKCGQAVRYKRHYSGHTEELRLKRYADNNDDPRRILSRVKSRAKQTGIPFNLTTCDILIPTHCPVLGIELVRKRGKGWTDSCPSVDRIRPELGYTKGNVRIISARANLLKSNASELELTAVLMDMRKLQKEGLV